MIHVPILRAGRPYVSKEVHLLADYATGRPAAEVSQANAGLIARDMREDAWSPLQDFTVAELVERLRGAADHFSRGSLPCGEQLQSPEEFVAIQSATTGLPYTLCRQNMQKIDAALRNMETILCGLTRGLDPGTLDAGFGQQGGHTVSFAPKARRFGAVLPANSPGVHGLWLAALPLKMPVALRPGQREPWTPLRILQAFRLAGIPPAALGFYPSGHDGASVLLRRCGAAMIFGSGPTVRPWLGSPKVEIHGPGYSKVILGAAESEQWRQHAGLVVESVVANGGRSCINASAVRCVSHADELADAVARQMAAVVPRARDDADALLAAFPDPAVADGINAAIERGLAQGGAEDVTARYRGNRRLVRFEGGTYLLPTVIRCQSPDHPLANQEYLFPFVGITEVTPDRLADSLGPSLVVTAITDDPTVRRRLLARSDIGRLNFGPVPTPRMQWSQPHEGNLFELLYQQRAFQVQPLQPAMAEMH
ncbi:MAG: aldehyde dehydrogenase family protein [Thermoguttaceae bacterium]